MQNYRKDIASLTGLRGIAASWVVIYHVHEFDPIRGPLGILLKHGYLAVDVFFLLSGFVMALTYRDYFAAGFSKRNYAVFMLRRLARVYPLYVLLTMAIVGLILRQTGPGFDWHALSTRLVFNLTLTEAWGLSSPFDGPGWSISTELAAYLLFPVLAMLTLYGRAWLAILTGVAAAIVIVTLAAVPTPIEALGLRQGPLDLYWAGTAWPLMRCIAEFSAGLLTYRVAQHRLVTGIAGRNGIALAVAAACLILLLRQGSDVLFVGLAPALILVLVSGENWLARLLSTSPLMALGRFSYAIYLLHLPLVLPVRRFGDAFFARLMPPGLADAASLLLFYGVLLALAAVAFYVIEEPARKAIRAVETRILPPLGRRPPHLKGSRIPPPVNAIAPHSA